LNPKELVSHVVHRGSREGLEVGLRAPEPDDMFHGESIAVQTGLCKIMHNSVPENLVFTRQSHAVSLAFVTD